MDRKIRYTWSDAWVLQAIGHAGRKKPAELWDVIASADADNHAIVTFEEISIALAKLTAAGYVVDYDGRFSLAPGFLPVYKSLQKQTRSFTGISPAVEECLDAESYPAVDRSGQWSYEPLERADYDEAVRRYQERARRLLRWIPGFPKEL